MRALPIVVAALLVALPSGGFAGTSSLSGTWALNRDAGEEPAFEVVGFEAPPELLTPDAVLAINIGDASVTIVPVDGIRRVLSLSGRREPINIRGLMVTGTAEWGGTTLRLELAAIPEVMVFQEYTVDETNRRLSVTMRPSIDRRQSGITIRYVYDRVATPRPDLALEAGINITWFRR